MMRIIFTIFITLMSTHVFSSDFEFKNNIIDGKHGYQVGDLLILKNTIISKEKFLELPALIDEKKPGIRLVKQNTNTFTEKGNHFFVHKLTYQIFQRSKGGNFSLPNHVYTIGKQKLTMPTQNYWFSQIVASDLNDVLINSLDQIKPFQLEVNKNNFYLLHVFTLLTLGILIYKKIDLPFIKKMNGPFAIAYKKINLLHKNSNQANYDESVLILLDSCNKSFGKNTNIFNIEELINSHSKFHSVKYAIKSFVALTNSEIYSSQNYYSEKRFNDVFQLVKMLRVIEKKI